MTYQVEMTSAPSLTVEAEASYVDEGGNLLFWDSRAAGTAENVCGIIRAGEWRWAQRIQVSKSRILTVRYLITDYGQMPVPEDFVAPSEDTEAFWRWHRAQGERLKQIINECPEGYVTPSTNYEGL